jgi:hypothetical protein
VAAYPASQNAVFLSPRLLDGNPHRTLRSRRAEAKFNQVDTKTKRVADDADFLTINPLG